MSNLHDLDGLDLMPFDEKGKKRETRLKDAESALAIYQQLLKADEGSAINRARIDGMFDGVAPYRSEQLAASGQTMKTNLNFGEAQRLLDISLSAYVDLYSSLERLVNVEGTIGENSERLQKEEIVAEELTHLFRSWPEFHSSYLRLCTTFLKHGVGISYFDSPDDWKFRVASFADVLIPRQSPASEQAIDIAIIRRSYHLHELQRFIDNEEAAEKVGWDVDAVKHAMLKHVNTHGRTSINSVSFATDYEALQAEIKNNDLHAGLRNPTVEILHFLVREVDGSVSHFMAPETDAKKFLYKKVSRYESPEHAYIFFTNGVGSNGTYHSVRGLGQRIFSHIQTSNRLRCQQVDGAMLSSAVMLQPENQRALDELEFSFYGPYAVMSPNVKIIEKAIPNLSQAVTPALQDISQQLALNTDTVSPYGPNQSSPYKNQMQIVADMDVATRLSGAALNLFYSSWTRLMREMVRRVVTSKKKCKLTKEFYKRCEARGVEEEFIKKLDTTRTKAVRSIGSGSQANRLVALRELQGIAGQFDEVGRRNLTRDIVSTRVGHDLADRYAPMVKEDRPTVDGKIALMENDSLMAGKPVPVFSNELHGEHLKGHLPAAEQLIEAYNTGQADPTQLLQPVQALYQHLAQTAGFAGADANLQGIVSQTKQTMQYLEEIINNTQKAIEAQQRAEAEAGAPEGQQPQPNPKLEQHQLDMQIKQEKAQMELDIKRRKFEQEQALRDAKAALDFREDSAGSEIANNPVPERSPFDAIRIQNS